MTIVYFVDFFCFGQGRTWTIVPYRGLPMYVRSRYVRIGTMYRTSHSIRTSYLTGNRWPVGQCIACPRSCLTRNKKCWTGVADWASHGERTHPSPHLSYCSGACRRHRAADGVCLDLAAQLARRSLREAA